MTRAILIIDHGSRRAEANDQLRYMAQLVEQLISDGTIVQYAHMELATPTIAEGFAECVRRGAKEVVAVPYMLAPGRHVTWDIPTLVHTAATAYPFVACYVTRALGPDRKLAQLVLERVAERRMVQTRRLRIQR
jgi:sirohydrochlorin ferrochelatase